ncbi:unnamed protein product [Chironomus riparius]|uniref:C-type LECtin n=1 Tax=Chironomus riparius TaxID=315576 RepID=A0A9N9RZ79_9DIPT|nr:unnamed protein product [Chironomus riparius]
MIYFKVLLFSFLLTEMLPTEALVIVDLLPSTNTTVNQTLSLFSCPPCNCQCVPIIFPSCSKPATIPGPIQVTTAAPIQETTLAPTTVAPTVPTTTIAPKVDVCTTTYQIKTASQANLKMLCYIAGNPQSVENATIFCAINGMRLYELSDADSVAGYQEFVNYYVTTTGPTFVSNGIQVNGQWVLFTNQTVPLYSGLTWGPTKVTSPTTIPSFLYKREENMVFLGYSYNYEARAYFMCQY